MKTIESLFFGDLEVPLESGNLRIEIGKSLVRIANASKLVNADRLLYSVIGYRSLDINPLELDGVTSANQMFYEIYSSTVDFSDLKFPNLQYMSSMFESTYAAVGYPSEFPSARNLQWSFRSSNLKKFLFNLPKAETIYCVADNCSNLEIVDTNLPVCGSAYHAFALCAKLKTVRITSPRCSFYDLIVSECRRVESVDILNANSGTVLSSVIMNFCAQFCTKLIKFTMEDTSRVSEANHAFTHTPSLEVVPLSWPLLSTGKGMFNMSNLNADQIDAILESHDNIRLGSIADFNACAHPNAAAIRLAVDDNDLMPHFHEGGLDIHGAGFPKIKFGNPRPVVLRPR